MNENRKMCFSIILLLAFALEFGGYLAFPFVSLRLRNGFGLSEAAVGQVFFVCLLLRPVFAVVGSKVLSGIKDWQGLAIACLCEGIGFLCLGLSQEPALAIAGLIIGNIGFSIWSPNLFAAVQNAKDPERMTARLVAAMNIGGVSGSLISGVIASFNATLIFTIAGLMFWSLIGLSYLGLPESPRPATNLETRRALDLSYTSQVVVLTLLFWAFYNQFNVYLPLFVIDTVKDEKWVGYAFAILSAAVAFLSAVISKLKSPGAFLKISMPLAALALAGIWIFLGSSPSVISLVLFVLVFAAADAIWVTKLATMWTAVDPTQVKFIQSLNFAIRNVGMGVGSYAGGLAYGTVIAGLSGWTVLSAGICLAAGLLVLFFKGKEGLKPVQAAGS
jgi:predicted MFS family arabinose efflux permease